MSKSLFEEAIADAKQLRDIAEQNAKKAIVEAVTPRIKEFIEMQLVNENATVKNDADDFLTSSLNEADDLDDEDVLITPSKAKNPEKMSEEDDEVELSESALTALVDLVTSKRQAPDALQEAFNQLSKDERETLLRIAKGEALAEGATQEDDKSKIDQKMSGDKKMRTGKQDLYELDLDDLNEDKITIDFGKDIELDKEMPYSVEVAPSDEEEEEVTLEEPEEETEIAPEPAEGGEEVEASAEVEEEGMDEMVYELDENTLRAALLGLREGRKSKKNESAKTNASTKAFGGGEVAGEVSMNKFAQLKEAFDNEVRKNRDLQNQLNEYRNGIETLREQLSELNLFNAKLLYVNKLSQSRDISAAQHKAVVEALDGAKNLREAKLIYTSLSESLDKGNSATISESARRLSPGHASRPTTTGGTKRLNESTQLDRWATLAGLK